MNTSDAVETKFEPNYFSINQSTGTGADAATATVSFTCLLCGCHLPNVKSFLEHLRFHTEEKPFSCMMCCELFFQLKILAKCGLIFDVEDDLKDSQSGPSDHLLPIIEEGENLDDNFIDNENFLHSDKILNDKDCFTDIGEEDMASIKYISLSEDIGGTIYESPPNREGPSSKNWPEFESADRDIAIPKVEPADLAKETPNLVKRKKGRPKKNISNTQNATPKKPKTPSKPSTPIKCPECQKEFSFKKGLEEHGKAEHPDKKLFICDTCNRGFSKQYRLRRHQIIHTDDKPFVCNVCGRSFRDAKTLKRHDVVHTGEKPFTCETCSRSFSRRNQLKSHILTLHTKFKPFVCEICDHGFSEARYLRKHHKRVHIAEKPLSCETCGKCYMWESQMILHKRSHTGEKPFACDVCSALFCSKGRLKRHGIVHTGEKPFTCDICGKCFNRQRNMKTHRLIHTRRKNEGAAVTITSSVTTPVSSPLNLTTSGFNNIAFLQQAKLELDNQLIVNHI